MLEQLSGDSKSVVDNFYRSLQLEVLPGALRDWAPRLPRLRTLELWDGVVLGDQLVQAAIHTNCTHFEALKIYTW